MAVSGVIRWECAWGCRVRLDAPVRTVITAGGDLDVEVDPEALDLARRVHAQLMHDYAE